MLALLLHQEAEGGRQEGLVAAIMTELQLQKLDDH